MLRDLALQLLCPLFNKPYCSLNDQQAYPNGGWAVVPSSGLLSSLSTMESAVSTLGPLFTRRVAGFWRLQNLLTFRVLWKRKIPATGDILLRSQFNMYTESPSEPAMDKKTWHFLQQALSLPFVTDPCSSLFRLSLWQLSPHHFGPYPSSGIIVLHTRHSNPKHSSAFTSLHLLKHDSNI